MSALVASQFSESGGLKEESEAGSISDPVEDHPHWTRANDPLRRKLLQLQKSELRYKSLLDGAVEGIFVADFSLKQFRYVNTALCRMLGRSREELLQLGLEEVFQKENWKKEPAETEASVNGQGPVVFESPCRRKDGSSFAARVSVTDVVVDGSSRSLCFLSDLTALKRAERVLKESEENFRRTLDDSPLGVRIVTAAGDTLYANRKLLDFYGYESLEELRNTPTRQRYHPSSYAEFLDRRLKRQRGERVPSEYKVTIIRKNGEPRRLQIFRKEILWNGTQQFQVLYNDITESEQAEEQRKALEEKLRRSEKLEFLGRLAGSVAHDLNNVLGALSGYSELLLMEVGENPKVRSYAENIRLSAQKGALIIQDLLTLTRRGVTVAQVIRLDSVVFEFFSSPVLHRIRREYPLVDIRYELEPNLLCIKGSPVHLEKALMNLVLNAVESIPGEGRVMVRTENRHLEEPLPGCTQIKNGDYVVLSVSDTGMGIPDEDRESIFEPFFSRKSSSRSGTGLGLSIVLGTVTDHDGGIEVQSKAGQGTRFSLYFPVTREEMAVPRGSETPERCLGGGESVLVIDDIDEQREVASAMLEKLGYRVHSVSSGEAALEYLKTSKADVLLLDMIMKPGMDGLETYRKVLEITNRQKAVIVSGFSETERVRAAQKLGAGAYVKKPYALETIALAIREVLDVR